MKYLRKFQTDAEYDNAQKLLTKSYVSLIADTGVLKYDKGIPVGVSIQHIDGALYTQDDWVSKGFTNEQANGVAIVANECAFVIAKDDISSSMEWSSDETTRIEGIKTTTDSTSAEMDYDGAKNTKLIVAVDTSKAAYSCDNYTFPNGSKGYLPALGEWAVAYENKSNINSAISLIGGTAISTKGYWSSTQYDKNIAWTYYWQGYGAGYSSKGILQAVRAFTALSL